jgi:hypothetical protein
MTNTSKQLRLEATRQSRGHKAETPEVAFPSAISSSRLSSMGVQCLPDQILRSAAAACGAPGLQCGSPECLPCKHICVQEGGCGIGQPMLLAKVTHGRRNLPKVAPRQAGEQMVLNLELQAAMEPIHPRRAQDVERACRLLLEPVVALGWPDVHIGREVVQAELDVLDPAEGKAEKHERHPLPPIRQARHQQRVPSPERGDTGDLKQPLRHPLLGQDEDSGLRQKIYPGDAHYRVEGPVLVADEEFRGGVEGQGPLVEAGPYVAEQLGGDSEERHVLEVRVMIQAVAGDVVRVVVAFPPRDAEASEAVSGEDLHDAVQERMARDAVVARVVAHPAGLDPDEADEPPSEHVRRGAGAGEDEVERRVEEDGHQGELYPGGGADALEEARGGELRQEAAVVGGRGGDGVVGEAADEEAAEERARRGRVVGGEGVGGVLPRQGDEREVAARVVGKPGRHVVHVARDGDPEVGGGRVLAELLGGDQAHVAGARGVSGGRHCVGRGRHCAAVAPMGGADLGGSEGEAGRIVEVGRLDL